MKNITAISLIAASGIVALGAGVVGTTIVRVPDEAVAAPITLPRDDVTPHVIIVERDVERVVTKTVHDTVTEYVDVPVVETVTIRDPDEYEQGYYDGRIEGEDWITSMLDRPCLIEDDINCYWNASVQGNGEGDSFVNVNGTVHYLD